MAPFLADMDFAYFAAKLGWSIDEYNASTVVQRAFIRKEIERQTVDMSELVAEAVELAIANAYRKRRKRVRLWKRKADASVPPPISKKEMAALSALMERDAPWSQWKGAKRG